MIEDGDILRHLDQRTYLLYPYYQYIPEGTTRNPDIDGAHVMFSIYHPDRGVQFGEHDPWRLHHVIHAIHAEQQQNSRLIWGYNNQPEPGTGQSWLNYHGHVTILPRFMKYSEIPVNRVREHGAHALEDLMTAWWSGPEAKHLERKLVRLVPKDEHGWTCPKGGVVFRFDTYPTAKKLTDFLMYLHGSYGGLRMSIGTRLVQSPGDYLRWASYPSRQPELLPRKARLKHMQEFADELNLGPLAARSLRTLAARLEDPLTRGRPLIKVTSYSVAGFMDEDKLTIAFGPRLKKPLGVLELLGIKLTRTPDRFADDTLRRTRARELANRLAAHAANACMI